MKNCQKAVEEKATEEKLILGLKKQLQEKLNEISEKNKVLLDLWRKTNEGEEKLLELRWKVSKIPDLEAKVQELEGIVSSQEETLAAHNKILLTY
ncbi:putative beta-galactosidase 7-like [Cocos nucifera]|uniref:Putative beta-galactosidase 7-like n=1 Tax=Cocos nucifera TaxID=13894 RepID=A0A8K0I294_COCNU|nr:putative beta-galactosidase 7-like [Cocos nucifera]